MAMSRWLACGVTLFLGVAFAACDSPDRRDNQETVTTKQERAHHLLVPALRRVHDGLLAPEAVAVGDLDGDGRTDVALLTSVASRPRQRQDGAHLLTKHRRDP